MPSAKPWDTRYEWRAVLLLFVGFGLVGLDRFAINPLFPVMMKDLNLNYQDLGNLSAVLAIAWGVGSIYMGRLSDKLGRRKILVPAVVVFSMMAGFTGMVGGIASLLAMRVIMGLSEGAFMPPSVAATIEASKPTRRGRNFGFQQTGLPIIGLGLGPIIATQVLHVTGSWRLTFLVVAIPGLIVAYLMYRVIREPSQISGGVEAAEVAAPLPAGGGAWSVFRHRNVVVASLIMICLAGGLNVVIAMTPSYLIEYLKVDVTHMGFIMSAIGVGALGLGIALPALSDRIGRKPVMAGAALCSAAAVGLFMNAPAQPVVLFLLLTAIAGFGFSVIYVNNGPLTMESVPATVASTAVGMVVGIGEIVGAVAPALAGYIADHYGIQHVFGLALVLIVLAAVLVLALREPAKAGVGGAA